MVYFWIYYRSNIIKRYTYKVRELISDKVLNNEKIDNVQEATDMKAMSFKKLRKKLDPKKRYFIEYTNKKGNFISTTISGNQKY